MAADQVPLPLEILSPPQPPHGQRSPHFLTSPALAISAGFQLWVSPVVTAGPWRDQTSPRVMEATPEAKGRFRQGRAGPSWLSPRTPGRHSRLFKPPLYSLYPTKTGDLQTVAAWAATSMGLPGRME